MRMRRFVALAAFLALSSPFSVSSRAAATAPERPTTTAAVTLPAASAPALAPQDPFTQELLDRLNAADPAQRAAAQRQLAIIAGYWQQPDLLQKMSDATADQEIKALIAQRLGDLKAGQLAKELTHLPPISLSVANAALAQIIISLNDALNSPNKIQAATGGGAGGPFTLDVKTKPFWEVFAALAQQQPLTFTGSTTGFWLTSGGTVLRRFAIDGPAFAYVGAINYRRSINLQTPGGDQPVQPELAVAVSMAVDPRIKIVRYGSLALLSAVDDAGHSLVRPGAAPARNYVTTTSNLHNQTFSLVPPATLGKSFALTCEARIVAQTSEIVGVINDVQNNIDKPVTVGNRSFRVTRFEVQPQRVTLQITGATVQAQPGETPARATFTLTDSTGKAFWTFSTLNSVSSSIASGTSTGPFKLEMHVPDKTVEIPVHFELKDIPWP